MACGATLKRTLDFDPLMSSASPKRRRCAPVMSPVSSPQKYLRMEPSPFGEVSSRLTTEQILHNIKQEYKRLQKRRHLDSAFQQADGCCPLDLPNIHTGSALPGTSSGASSPTRKEQPLFSLRQVGMICERLLKEREDKIREEYDEILTTKLAEQYDAFVKFTHDQLMRRFGEQPASYVSWVSAFWSGGKPFAASNSRDSVGLVGLSPSCAISPLCGLTASGFSQWHPRLLLLPELGGLPAANMFEDSLWLYQWPLNCRVNIYLALFWRLRKRLTATILLAFWFLFYFFLSNLVISQRRC